MAWRPDFIFTTGLDPAGWWPGRLGDLPPPLDRLPLPLRVDRLEGPAAIEPIAREWAALDAAISPRTPFTSSLWNELWWRHLSAHGWLISDEFFIHTVRDRNRRLVAVAPLILTHRPGIGPWRSRELQFFGADPNITEIRGLICRPEHHDAVITALLMAFEEAPEAWDWQTWGRLARNDDGSCRSLDPASVAQTDETLAFVIDLPDSWTALRARLPRNIKESLRKCYNTLKREGHRLELRVVERPDNAATALARFFALHAARANSDLAVRHKDIFADAAARRFLIDYATTMAAAGQLRLFELAVNGEVRASRIGFLFDDELYLYYSGYDPDWAKFSIMTTAVAEIIQWAIGQRLRLVNLSTGSDVSKTRWRPREIVYAEAVQIAPSARSRAAYRLFAAVRHASRNTNLIRQVRKFSRSNRRRGRS